MSVSVVSNVEYRGFNNCSIEECVEYLNNQTVVGLDIETTKAFPKKNYQKEGLDPYLSKIVMLQIGTLERQFIIDVRDISLTSLYPILENKNIIKVGHNLKFEYTHILHNTKVRLDGIYDTMITEQILYNGLPRKFSLKALMGYYLDESVNKDTRLEFLTIGDKAFTHEQIVYGAGDITVPLRIRELQIPEIIKKDVRQCVQLEMEYLKVLGDLEYKGLYFDKAIWKALYEENLEKQQSILNQLDEFVLKNYPDTNFINRQLDLFGGGVTCNINWGSPKQVVDFFKYLEVCPQEVSKSTEKLSFTVNAKVIKSSFNTMNKDIEPELKDFLKLYIKYKETNQLCTTFGLDFFKYINPITGRLHSNYKQILVTGRISSSGPNLQNIPSDDRFRRAFSCPSGWKIVNADYSGQETVVLANKSQEPNMIKLINNGGDMHVFVAKAIHPELKTLTDKEFKDKHGDKRGVAKAAGFAIQFGGNGSTIAGNLGITKEAGDFVYNSYFKAFPILKRFFKKVQAKSIREGHILVDRITRRKYFFTPPKDFREEGRIKKLTLNYIIQGEAGAITKMAAIKFRAWILENGYEDFIFMTNNVHDELNVEAIERLAKLAAENLERCMVEAGAIWCKVVPLKADAVITDYWTH